MSIEVEAAVLSGMMSCAENAAIAAQRLEKYEFSDEDHQVVFNEIVSYHDFKGEVNDTAIRAKCLGKVSDETWYLIDQFPESEEFSEYVESLYREGRRKEGRRLLRKAERAFEEEDDPDVVFDMISTGAGESNSVAAGAKTSHDMDSMIEDFLTKFEQRSQSGEVFQGMPSEFTDLDEQIQGFGPGDLIIIAGRPAMGKTTFAMNIMENMMRKGGRGLMFSLEMPSDQITNRMMASIGSINLGRIKSAKLTPAEAARFPDAVKRVAKYSFRCEDEGNINWPKLKRITIKEHRKNPLTALMIDYLQLMDLGDGKETTANKIGVITAGLKALAKFLGIPIIVLSQLNRSLEQRADKRPMNSDLRESGAIEQDADVIMFVYRDEVYNPATEHKGVAEIIIGKQRNGPIGTVFLGFEGQYSRFINLKKETGPLTTEVNF